MNTYFVRHNTGIWIDDATRQRLWKERRIAIHFGRYPYTTKKMTRDCSSISPDDYTGSAKSCMRTLVELAKEGGYVCAQHHRHTDWVLGFVPPHSKIQLFKGKWRDDCDLRGQTAVLKTLRLTKVRLVKPLDHAVLHVGRPRQGTIVRWHLAGKTVENLVEGHRTKPKLSDLTPDQQEILCSEFLRLPEAAALGLPQLAHLIMPTGRTMRDIDIVGIASDSKRLYSQVTFASLPAATRKLQPLHPYRNAHRNNLVFFCDCPEQTSDHGITIFPIQKAYEIFTATPLGKLWLQRSA